MAKEKIIFDPITAPDGDIIGSHVLSSVLPTGAASEASLATRASEATLSSVDSQLTAANSSLDAIEASESASSASLASIDSKIVVESGAIKVTGSLAETVPNTAAAFTSTAMSTTAVKLVSSSLANRKVLMVQNAGGRDLYIGNSSVTQANGWRLSPGSVQKFEIGPAIELWGVTASSTTDARIAEFS